MRSESARDAGGVHGKAILPWASLTMIQLASMIQLGYNWDTTGTTDYDITGTTDYDTTGLIDYDTTGTVRMTGCISHDWVHLP